MNTKGAKACLSCVSGVVQETSGADAARTNRKTRVRLKLKLLIEELAKQRMRIYSSHSRYVEEHPNGVCTTLRWQLPDHARHLKEYLPGRRIVTARAMSVDRV